LKHEHGGAASRFFRPPYGATNEQVRAVPDLIAEGYQLVTLLELLSFSENAVEAGKVVYRR
jgi:hypothetical protein